MNLNELPTIPYACPRCGAMNRATVYQSANPTGRVECTIDFRCSACKLTFLLEDFDSTPPDIREVLLKAFGVHRIEFEINSAKDRLDLRKYLRDKGWSLMAVSEAIRKEPVVLDGLTYAEALVESRLLALRHIAHRIVGS